MTEADPRQRRQRPGRAGLGAAAERLAAGFLAERGYAIIGRNVRVAGGEIDLIAISGGQTVFVEVRSRRDGDLGAALSSLTATKQRRMVRAAENYLALHPELPPEARIDFVAVALSASGQLRRIDLVVDAVNG